MIFGRLLPKLAKSGDWQRTLMILGKGDFGPEKYNESYLSFIENQHRKQGLDVIQSAHEKFPSDTIILENLAKCHAFYEDFVTASTYFKKLLNLKPDDASVMATYGRVLAMTGKTAEAKKMFEKGLNCAEAQNEKQLIEQFKVNLNLLNEM